MKARKAQPYIRLRWGRAKGNGRKMKKKILLWIACIVMGLAVAACAAPEPEESAETENTGDNKGEGASGKFEGDAKDYKVALLIPGSLGDKSFFDAS